VFGLANVSLAGLDGKKSARGFRSRQRKPLRSGGVASRPSLARNPGRGKL